MKNKNKHLGYYTGAKFEKVIIEQLSKEGFEPVKDKTLSDGKRRVKDLKADILVNTGHKLECKTTTDKTNLTFAVFEDGRKVNIKFHQICAADYFLFEFRPNPTFVVKKTDFLIWWSNLPTNKKGKTKMSIVWKDVKKIGFKLKDFSFLKEEK